MIILDFVALTLVMSLSKIDILPAKVVELVSRGIIGPSGRNATPYPNLQFCQSGRRRRRALSNHLSFDDEVGLHSELTRVIATLLSGLLICYCERILVYRSLVQTWTSSLTEPLNIMLSVRMGYVDHELGSWMPESHSTAEGEGVVACRDLMQHSLRGDQCWEVLYSFTTFWVDMW